MVRLLVVAVLVFILLIVGVRLFGWARRAPIDWTGVAAALGFVGLAFYLRHVTGMG